MGEIASITAQIRAIGESLVRCDGKCKGIAANLNEGILPRCLVLETEGRAGDVGCAVVGINPGQCWPVERQFYVQNGPTYQSVLGFWDAAVKDLRYYKRLRHLADELGLAGPILWTELVKCESEEGAGLPPLQTFRTCTMAHLSRELALIPDDWPLVAVGHEAFKALAYLYPTRAVVGVPHPTGSYGQFPRLFDGYGHLRPEFKAGLARFWDGELGLALWADTREGRLGFR